MNTGRSPQRRAAPSPCALFGERRDDERVARAGERVDRRVRSLTSASRQMLDVARRSTVARVRDSALNLRTFAGGPRALDADLRRPPKSPFALPSPAGPQVLHDHGPRRGRPLGRADALPAHAVHRRLLPAGRRLPARRRPAQGPSSGVPRGNLLSPHEFLVLRSTCSRATTATRRAARRASPSSCRTTCSTASRPARRRCPSRTPTRPSSWRTRRPTSGGRSAARTARARPTRPSRATRRCSSRRTT